MLNFGLDYDSFHKKMQPDMFELYFSKSKIMKGIVWQMYIVILFLSAFRLMYVPGVPGLADQQYALANAITGKML